MSEQIIDQPPPVPNDRPSIQSMVRADLEDRERVGIERYGTPLQAHNGRDPLVDAYQEALDLACYLRQAIAEEGPDEPDYCGVTSEFGVCHRPPRHEGRVHATIIGGGADPFDNDPQVWFAWDGSGALGSMSAAIRLGSRHDHR